MTYLAHIAEDGREQTVDAHLQGTGELAAYFASAFQAEEHGRLVGLAHDIGKYTEGFQKRLHGGPKVDHATAGAIVEHSQKRTVSLFCHGCHASPEGHGVF